MTPQEMRNVLADIKYKHGYTLILRPFLPNGFMATYVPSDSDRYYLQVSASIPFPPPTRGSKIWKGRKWALSSHMTKSELVLTAFKAFLTFEEHECREAFTYKGQKVCGPHIDMDKLATELANGWISTEERS